MHAGPRDFEGNARPDSDRSGKIFTRDFNGLVPETVGNTQLKPAGRFSGI